MNLTELLVGHDARGGFSVIIPPSRCKSTNQLTSPAPQGKNQWLRKPGREVWSRWDSSESRRRVTAAVSDWMGIESATALLGLSQGIKGLHVLALSHNSDNTHCTEPLVWKGIKGFFFLLKSFTQVGFCVSPTWLGCRRERRLSMRRFGGSLKKVFYFFYFQQARAYYNCFPNKPLKCCIIVKWFLK